VKNLKEYAAVSALNLGDWRPGFTRVIFRRGGDAEAAIELPCNLYRAVCGGPSCSGKTLEDFARLFATGLVKMAPASFADYYTRGRVVLGETYCGNRLGREMDEWIAARQ